MPVSVFRASEGIGERCVEAGEEREADLLIELARTLACKQVLGGEAREVHLRARGRVRGLARAASAERSPVGLDRHAHGGIRDGRAEHGVARLVVSGSRETVDAPAGARPGDSPRHVPKVHQP
jgi:hypothetical protein